MAVKFLDLTGLQKFWTKCKNAFVAKDSSGDVSVDGDLQVNGTTTFYDNAYAGGELSVGGTLWIDGGFEVKGGAIFKNSDETKSVSLECNNDGKLAMGDSVVATVADVNTAVANAGHLKREVVSALPGVATAKENVIYMVSNSTTGNNKFDEYMLINGAFEKTGSSDVDLSGYSTTVQMNTAISTAITNAHTAITEAEINALT